MVQVSDQDMNTHLAEISRVRATELLRSKGSARLPAAEPGTGAGRYGEEWGIAEWAWHVGQASCFDGN